MMNQRLRLIAGILKCAPIEETVVAALKNNGKLLRVKENNFRLTPGCRALRRATRDDAGEKRMKDDGDNCILGLYSQFAFLHHTKDRKRGRDRVLLMAGFFSMTHYLQEKSRNS